MDTLNLSTSVKCLLSPALNCLAYFILTVLVINVFMLTPLEVGGKKTFEEETKAETAQTMAYSDS